MAKRKIGTDLSAVADGKGGALASRTRKVVVPATSPPGGVAAPSGDEGDAAMSMLRATRDPVWADPPFPEVVEAVARPVRDDADRTRDATLRAFERGLSPGRQVFAREKAGRAWMVTLTSIDPHARRPVRCKTSSASFLAGRVRDDLFGWIVERVHGWRVWGDAFRGKGASSLTSQILSMLVAHPPGAVAGSSGREARG